MVDKAIGQKEAWDGHAGGGKNRGIQSMRKRSGSGGGHQRVRGEGDNLMKRSNELMGNWLERDRPAVRYDDASYSSYSEDDMRRGRGRNIIGKAE